MRCIFKLLIIIFLVAACPVCALAQGHGHGQGHMSENGLVDESIEAGQDTIPQVITLIKENDTYKINTTTIGGKVIGFNGRVPLMITIKGGKVVKVEALPNDETPRFMDMAKVLLIRWNGKSVKDAQSLRVDAVSGATYTSKAIKENVHLGLEYYQKNRE